MKRYLIFAVVLVFVTSALSAQMFIPKFGFGPKAGINFSNVWGEDAEGAEIKFGFFGGGWVDYSFNPMLAVQGELLYTMKGAKDEPNDSTTYTMSLDYLEIPILLKYNLPIPNPMMSFSLYGGAGIGILLRAEGKMEIGGDSDTQDMKDDMNSMDVGGIIGGTFEFNKIIVDARYTMGMMNVPKEVNGVQPEWKNYAISLGVGYRIF